MKFKKIIACTCLAAISISVINPVYAQAETVTLISSKDVEKSQKAEDSSITEKVKPLDLTQKSDDKKGIEKKKSN